MFNFSGVGIGMAVYLRDHFTQNANRINASMLQMYGNTKALKAGLTDNLNGLAMVGGAVFGAGLLAARGITHMVKIGMEFNKIMDSVAAVSDANIKQMEEMRGKAIQLGKSTVFSIREVGQAMEDLAKAGFTPEQINQSITGVTHLAAASSFGLLQSADILNNVMQIYGKSAQDSEHVADLLTYAVNKSNIDMGDMFEALKYFGDIATSLNIPLEDSLALIMKLGNAGIKGSIAGTSLGNMLRYLTKAVTPFATKRQLEGLSMLGLAPKDFIDAKGALIPVTQMVDKLTAASRTLNTIESQAAFEAIFGVRGKRGITPLMRMSEIGGSVQSYADALKSSDVMGSAQRVSEQKLDNLAGDVKKLNSAWEALAATFTEKVEPFLRGLISSLTWVVNGIQTIISSPIGGVISAAVVALTGWAIAWGGIRLLVGLFGNVFLRSTATFKTMGMTLSMVLNQVLGQLFGINRGLSSLGINSLGRGYVKGGQTYTFGGKTYKGGQILPKGAVNPTGTSMGKGMGNIFGGLFSFLGAKGGSATGGLLGGLGNILKGGLGRVFGSIFSMIGGWWGIGLTLIGSLLFNFKGTITFLSDMLNNLGSTIINVIRALNPFTAIEKGLDWIGEQFGGNSPDKQRRTEMGIFDRDKYYSDLYGGAGTEGKDYYTGGKDNNGGGSNKKVLQNYIYIDGKLSLMQQYNDDVEGQITTQLGN